ncbi:sensor histidine kinase [Paracoccus aerius]
MHHRTRNLMTVVLALSDMTARSSTDLDHFRVRFQSRLEALARVQGLLSRLSDLDRVTFDELIQNELEAMGGDPDRITLDGPSGIRLRSSTVQTLAMALHELATNAVKYGALGQTGGRLAVTWSLDADDHADTPWLHIDWRETGITLPAEGASSCVKGQGRELIERALPYQLKARTTYSLTDDGVHCTIALPVSASPGKDQQHG